MACACTLVTNAASFGVPSYSQMTDTFSLLELNCTVKSNTYITSLLVITISNPAIFCAPFTKTTATHTTVQAPGM
jgi:hypothetical protein